MIDACVRSGKFALLCVAALPVVVAVRLILTCASHRAVLPFIPKGRSGVAHPAMSFRIGRATKIAAAIVPGASCLTQALAAQYLLACRGYASQVRIGVKLGADNQVEAHAWLVSGPVIATGGTPGEIAAFNTLTDLSLEPH